LISFALIFILSKVTYYIDKHLINNNSDPIFVVHIKTTKDGRCSRYVGIGYEIIYWNINKGKENSFITDCEINSFPNFKDMNDFYNGEIK